MEITYSDVFFATACAGAGYAARHLQWLISEFQKSRRWNKTRKQLREYDSY